MNLITYLIENKLAKNEPHANAKIALLKLQDICNDEAAVIARVQLYEAHKASKLHGKNDRAICAEMAIKGIPVPQSMVDMFALSPIQQIIKKGVAACQEHGFSFIQLYKLTNEENVKDGWDLYIISPVHLSEADYYYCGIIRADGTTDIRQ